VVDAARSEFSLDIACTAICRALFGELILTKRRIGFFSNE
jgi:hypothetical protein